MTQKHEITRLTAGHYAVFVASRREGTIFRDGSRWYAFLYDTGTLIEHGSRSFADAKEMVDGYYADIQAWDDPAPSPITAEDADWQAREMMDDDRETPPHDDGCRCPECDPDLWREESLLDHALYQRIDNHARRAQMHTFARSAALASCLLLSLAGSAMAAPLPEPPIGCAITGAWEDHSAIAVCAGSYLVTLDAESQVWHDIPMAIGTQYITDDNGRVWAWAIWD